MPELLGDFITSLDGYGAADGWPGWWGARRGPNTWRGWTSSPGGYTVLMGATTYRVISGYAAEGEPGTDSLAAMSKVVFSTKLHEPLSWPNTKLVARDAVEAVREMKQNGSESMLKWAASRCVARSSRPGSWTGSACSSSPSSPGSRSGADLRRVSRRRARHDSQPHVGRPHPDARIRTEGPHRAAGHRHGLMHPHGRAVRRAARIFTRDVGFRGDTAVSRRTIRERRDR